MKKAQCNLCGKFTDMTKEHVPPQSVGNKGRVKTYQSFIFPTTKQPMQIKQNGIYYETLCEECNNLVMGRDADIALTSLCNKVECQLQSLSKGQSIKIIDVDIKKVVKCIFGKFIAMESFYNKYKMYEDMRDYIFNDNLPEYMGLYVRVYPYKKQVHSKNVGIYPVKKDFYGPQNLVSLLYFYPLAFILSCEKQKLNMVDLIDCVGQNNTIRELEIKTDSAYNPITNELLPYDWLNNPSSGDYVLLVAPNAVNIKGV